jgi:hypothetical protein
MHNKLVIYETRLQRWTLALPVRTTHIRLSRQWSWWRRGSGWHVWYVHWNLNQKHQQWHDACTWSWSETGSHQGLQSFILMKLFIGLRFDWRRYEVSEYQPVNWFKNDRIGVKKWMVVSCKRTPYAGDLVKTREWTTLRTSPSLTLSLILWKPKRFPS